jgi:hypothetical protein
MASNHTSVTVSGLRIECNAGSGFAEAFYARKARLRI